MLNIFTGGGRLVADPELRQTATGKSVCNFVLACDRDFTAPGEEKKADFIDCVAWGSQAEFVSKYFKKGALMIVTGRLCIRDWVDKDGKKRRSTEIATSGIYFGASANKDAATGPAPVTERKPAFSSISDDDGELPF